MLSVTKNITLTGNTIIDGKIAENHIATINSDNPSQININVGVKINKELSEANLAECREDRNAFEDMAIALKNELIAVQKTTEEESES